MEVGNSERGNSEDSGKGYSHALKEGLTFSRDSKEGNWKDPIRGNFIDPVEGKIRLMDTTGMLGKGTRRILEIGKWGWRTPNTLRRGPVRGELSVQGRETLMSRLKRWETPRIQGMKTPKTRGR